MLQYDTVLAGINAITRDYTAAVQRLTLTSVRQMHVLLHSFDCLSPPCDAIRGHRSRRAIVSCPTI